MLQKLAEKYCFMWSGKDWKIWTCDPLKKNIQQKLQPCGMPQQMSIGTTCFAVPTSMGFFHWKRPESTNCIKQICTENVSNGLFHINFNKIRLFTRASEQNEQANNFFTWANERMIFHERTNDFSRANERSGTLIEICYSNTKRRSLSQTWWLDFRP